MTPNFLLRSPGGKEGVQQCSVQISSYDFSVNDVIPLLLQCSLKEGRVRSVQQTSERAAHTIISSLSPH